MIKLYFSMFKHNNKLNWINFCTFIRYTIIGTLDNETVDFAALFTVTINKKERCVVPS